MSLGKTPEEIAIERAEWRGVMNERLKSGDKKFKSIDESITAIEKSQSAMAVELATVKTKVALYGALGGLAGSAVVGVVVVIATKGF